MVGGGPAGMMAAIRASQLRQNCILIERNPTLGRKLLLSGKGRCNLTNTGDLNSFLARFSGGGQFLRDAFKRFFYPDLMRFFEERGLKLKVERQLRVFPQTDRAASVLEVLEKELVRNKVKVLTRSLFKDIVVEGNRATGIIFENASVCAAHAVILATGGVSYGFTGSTGDGIRAAEKLGHSVVAMRQGLVPLVAKEQFIRRLEGLTLKNIRITFSDGAREMVSPVGELLFTAKGISGPLVLSLSGAIVDWLATKKTIFADIDLKSALSIEQLNARLLREFQLNAKKSIKNTLKEMLPLKLIEVFIQQSRIDPDKKANQITQPERASLVFLLKSMRLTVIGAEPLKEAMVTQGGVALKNIIPRTMESRIIKGLYFCGEMIDVDADTGGFNLQAAFSTGYLAGQSAAESCL